MKIDFLSIIVTQVTPATPSRRLSTENAEPSTEVQTEVKTEEACEEGKKAEEGEDGKVKSKPGVTGSKKPSKTVENNPIKSSESKASKPSAKGADPAGSKVGPGSKAGSVKLTSKTPASAAARQLGGKGEVSKSAAPGKVATVSKAPALGVARTKAGGPSASKGGEGETFLRGSGLPLPFESPLTKKPPGAKGLQKVLGKPPDKAV